ncbi:hypothetical protein [Spiroplasma melliferum]|uniref:Major capsid protein n=2 Tax=Spiroplasma melliferum TaxID=2134 RepID=A0AAI9X1E5_SPIME|nr:hypothetical protein [Spiroplasma melliferum]KAI93157.1 hypothetical protein SPM_002820 [Spiroplasma melliferum KC3]QCO23900.1 hypothetical protein SRED_002380 [Spiroplasma melliferum]
MAKVGGKSSIALPTVFQVGGNTATEKAIGDIAVLQIKRILEADSEYIDATEMMMLTAQQVTMAEGWEQGQYVFPERMVWGTDYDMDSGMEQQSVAVRRATVMMDQMLTFKYDVPTFDVVRFMESPVEVRTTTIGEWMRTITRNWYSNMNAIYLQGVVDSCIATGQFVKLPIPTDTDTAQDTFYKINDISINLVQKVSALMFGTKKDDLMVHVSMPAFAQFSKAYIKILEQIAADTLATGQLWKKMILGVDVFESWYLGREFKKGKDTGINKDLDFTLNYNKTVGAWGFTGHTQDCAMPQGWRSIQQVINQNTGNVRYMGRGLYSLPTFMRGLHTLYVTGDPSNDDITKAQANRGITFELAPWMELTPPAKKQSEI